MALDTKGTYKDPEVTITVSDDGGGDKKHKAALLVCWDPKLVKFKGYVKPKGKVDKKKGSCLWPARKVPGTGKKFKLELESKGKGDAYVCFAAVDVEKEQVDGDSVEIPDA